MLDILKILPTFSHDISVLGYNYSVLESFQHIYRFKSVLEENAYFGAFRDKIRGNPQLTIEPVRRSIFGDKHRSMHIMCRQSTANRARFIQVSSRLNSQVTTYLQKYQWPTFDLIFMCSSIVLGNNAFIFSTFHSK